MKILRLMGFSPPDWRAHPSATSDYGFAITCGQAASPVRESSWLVGEKGSVKLTADITGSFHSFIGAGLRSRDGRCSRDYDIPSHTRIGLPLWEEESATSSTMQPSLKSVVYEQDPGAGDIVIDWSDGAPADAVLISPLKNDIWLCSHYQQSTQRWVGLSLRNVPVTIMNDCSLFDNEWSPRTSLQADWRRLLRSQAAE